jgi:hypothetical protein
MLAIGIAVLRNRRTARFAQDHRGAVLPRQGAHGNERAQVEACFGTDDGGGGEIADGAAQSGDCVTQLVCADLNHGNGWIEQRPQRAFVTQHQKCDGDAFGSERIAEQHHVALRAATDEGGHHHRETRPTSLPTHQHNDAVSPGPRHD